MMTERDISIASACGTGMVLAAALLIALMPALLPAGCRLGQADAAPTKFESIEVALAYKASPKVTQPQKVQAAVPDPVADGVTRDDKQPVPTCKIDADCGPGRQCVAGTCTRTKSTAPPPDDQPVDLSQFRRGDEEGGTQTQERGQFDGSEFGFAEENKGDPFFRQLVADLRSGWEYPAIADGQGTPVGCFQIRPNGEIARTLFKEKSGAADLDLSVEQAMAKLKKSRDDRPIEVPAHLLATATTRWICFRFKL